MVSGSNLLLDAGETKILIDCGMFQGPRRFEKKNYEPFPYNPKDIDFVLVTHAHADHTGRIPKLCKEGFSGKIFATKPTRDLAKIMLEDSAGLIKHEAEKLKKPPFFDESDVEKAMKLFEGVDYDNKINLAENIVCNFKDAGHILGSSIIEIEIKTRKSADKKRTGADKDKFKIVFTGDLGNPPVPLLKATEIVEKADYVVIESVYGNRLHEKREERKLLLERVIEDTITRGGVLMIPAFSLERTQELLYELNELVENHRIPEIPIFVDSPLAIRATEIYKKYPGYYGKEAAYIIKSGDQLFNFPHLTLTLTVEESKKINEVPPPKVIIAGSAMSTGGRILHHERRYLKDPKSMLLIIGYQVDGTLGRRILDGAESVKIFGEEIPVRCKVKAIGGYSAHADQKGLFDWLSKIEKPIKKVFVVQGERKASLALSQIIKDRLAVSTQIPKLGDVVGLE